MLPRRTHVHVPSLKRVGKSQLADWNESLDECPCIDLVLVVLSDDCREDSGLLNHIMLDSENTSDIFQVLLGLAMELQRGEHAPVLEPFTQLYLHDVAGFAGT